MAAVRFLELSGHPPHLRAGSASFDALQATLSADTSNEPRARLFEWTGSHDGALDWSCITRLRTTMLDLLHQHVPKRLVGRVMLCLDTSQGRLEHPSAHTALRRQADRGVLGSVFEIALPRAGSARNVEQHIASWIALLSHEDQRPERRRIERPPPAERETMSTSREVLRVLLADTANFRDSASVGRALAGDPLHRNPKMVASRARKRGLIFGVWDGNAYRYPSFQFDGVGQPRADVADLLVVLPRDADGSGRDAALWLFAPDAALDDRAPYEVFA